MSKLSLLFNYFLIGLLSASALYAPSLLGGEPAPREAAAESVPADAAEETAGAVKESEPDAAGVFSETDGRAAEGAQSGKASPAAETEAAGEEKAADSEPGSRDEQTEDQPPENERTVPAEAIAPRIAWEASFPGPIAWLACGNNTVAAASEFNSAAFVYDLNSGALLWSKKMPVVAANAPIYVDTMTVFLHKNNSLSAYLSASGDLKYDLLSFPYEKKPSENSEAAAQTEDRRQRAVQKAKAKAEERRLYQLAIKNKIGSRKQIAHGSPVSCGPYVACASDNGILTISKNLGKDINWYRLPFDSGLFRGVFGTPAAVKYEQKHYLYIASADGQLCTVDLDDPSYPEVQTIGASKHEFRLPAAINGFNLYLTSTDGTVFCFDIKALRLRDQYSDFTPKPVWQWSAHSGRTYQTDCQDDFVNKPCFDGSGRRLFTVSDNKLHALSATFGKPLWTYALPDFKPVCPAVYWRGHVVTADDKSRLCFFNAETGSPEKIFSLPALPTTELTVAEDKLLMGIKGRILCWKLTSD